MTWTRVTPIERLVIDFFFFDFFFFFLDIYSKPNRTAFFHLIASINENGDDGEEDVSYHCTEARSSPPKLIKNDGGRLSTSTNSITPARPLPQNSDKDIKRHRTLSLYTCFLQIIKTLQRLHEDQLGPGRRD